MIEPEMAFMDHEDSLKVQENYVSFIVQSVLENCALELKTLERDISKLENIKAPFPRISYDKAVEFLKEKGFDDIEWEKTSVHHMRQQLLKASTSLFSLQIIRKTLKHFI